MPSKAENLHAAAALVANAWLDSQPQELHQQLAQTFQEGGEIRVNVRLRYLLGEHEVAVQIAEYDGEIIAEGIYTGVKICLR